MTTFIRIDSNGEISLEVCDKLATSYMFEMQSTLGLTLEFSAGRAETFELSEDDTKQFLKEVIVFFRYFMVKESTNCKNLL